MAHGGAINHTSLSEGTESPEALASSGQKSS